MSTLASIKNEIFSVLQSAEEYDSETLPSVSEYLDALAIQEEEKVDAISYALRRRESDIEWLREEEKRIASRRRAAENRVREFRDYLAKVLAANGIKKIKGKKSSLWLKDSVSVHVDSLGELPEQFQLVTVDTRPDKKAIKDAMEHGENVPGARLVTGTTLVVR